MRKSSVATDIARLVELDKEVDFAEGEGIRQRWMFGKELLAERIYDEQFKRWQLPAGLLDDLHEKTKKSRAELKFRAQFAEKCADGEAVANAVSHHKSWHDIVNEFLSGRAPLESGVDELYTPLEYIEAARRVMGDIDLDPATSDVAQATVRATRYFTKDDDGLTQPWHGRVWLNPPYSKKLIAQFVKKLLDELECGNVTEAIMLTHNYTEVAWWQMACDAGMPICFHSKRIQFLDVKGNEGQPTQGQCFFYFGENELKFREEFTKFGPIR